MNFYVVLNPATGQVAALNEQKRLIASRGGHAPHVIATENTAQNYQSAMNVDHGPGWENGFIDLSNLTVTVTKTESE